MCNMRDKGALWWGTACLLAAVVLTALAAVAGGNMTDNPVLLLALLPTLAGVALVIVGGVRRLSSR